MTDIIDEPLPLTAPMMRAWAATCCTAGANGQSCAYYHGFWQYLRLMGLGPTLGGHGGTYLQAMSDMAKEWLASGDGGGLQRHVLVSGCADSSMLAHVLQALDAFGLSPRVTVLDICPTPLKLNTWHAQRCARPVEVVCSDLLQHGRANAYDLIVTSSFMGYFSPTDRPRMFAAYARMMRDGGRLMFSNRLRAGPESEPVGFSALQAAQFADTVVELARGLPASATLEAQEARSMAMAYGSLRRPYPVNSVDTIRQLAATAGLRWVKEIPVHSSAVKPGLSGPTLGDGSRYVFAVLEK